MAERGGRKQKRRREGGIDAPPLAVFTPVFRDRFRRRTEDEKRLDSLRKRKKLKEEGERLGERRGKFLFLSPREAKKSQLLQAEGTDAPPAAGIKIGKKAANLPILIFYR